MKGLLIAALRLLVRAAFRVRLEGERNVRAARLLIVANHESFLDELLLGLFLPQRPIFVVHESATERRLVRWTLKLFDHVVIDPTCPMAMKRVIRLVESGRPVAIFPEGRVTTTGNLMKTYEGSGFIAARSGATLLPVRIDGAARTHFSLLGGHFRHCLFPRIRLVFQPTTRIEVPRAAHTEQHRLAGEAMHRVMLEMVFASRPQQTIWQALLDAAEQHGRRWRVVKDVSRREWSYADLLQRALQRGRQLARLTAEQEHVALLLPNSAELLATLFALGAFRRVPALLNPGAGLPGMQSACTLARVRILVSTRAFVTEAQLADTLVALQGVRVVYLEDLAATRSLADRVWWQAWARWLPRHASRPAHTEDAAVLLFTSGSEGRPKGVVLSHRALLANIAQMQTVIDFSVNEVVFNALPLFHAFGLTCGALVPLLRGARVSLYPSPLRYRVLHELAYEDSCTILLGTNAFLANHAKRAHPYDFYRLRLVIAGAERVTEAVRRTWFEKFGVRIFEGYGATETAPVLAVNTQMSYRSGSVGKLLPGVEARLLPVPGLATNEAGSGVLHVRGPNLMSGYLREDASGALEPPASAAGAGWYDTGDVVEIDDEGFVRIIGRVKHFAKVAGEMVSLGVVEQLATRAAPGYVHAASTRADAQRGEAILLFTTDRRLAREHLQAVARAAGWPEIVLPRRIIAVDALPVLGTGKTDYLTLKQWAESA